mmetsp:Transcript_35074/g.62696  ORF Transcript_35074/g.62696 Transcript_35074/m.62696 type:complete len:200 (-) Transcript_35074:596-1195(-)
MTFSSVARRLRFRPKIASLAVAFFLASSFLSMNNMKVPSSSSMRPSVARRSPVTYPTQSCGMCRTVTSGRWSVSISHCPSSWSMIHPRYSAALCRSALSPDMWTQLPMYSTRQPEARASFLRVAPFLPRAHDISLIFRRMMSVPHSSVSEVCSSILSVKYPSSLFSMAARTFSSAPRRPLRSPNMANCSPSRRPPSRRP